MNEEIVVGMGLDTSAFGKGIRHAKSLMHDFKDDIGGVGELLKRSMETLGVTLAFAGIVEAGKKIIEFSAHINDFAHDIGVSTDFLQQFDFAARHTGATSEEAEKGLGKFAVNIGKVREGSSEAAAMFDKFGISTTDVNGNLKSIQEVAEEAGKKLAAIEDPATRAAMAFELFGKSGYKLIGALTELDKFKEESKGKIVSESDLATLKSAEEHAGNLGKTLMAFGAKGLSAAATIFGVSDVNAPLNAMIKAREDLASKAAGEDAEVKASKAKSMAEALNALYAARNQERLKGLNDESKLAELKVQEANQIDKVNALQDGTVERIKAQIELEKIQGELHEQQNKVEKNWHEAKDKKLKEANEKKEKELNLQYEINNANREHVDAEDKLNQAKGERSQLSIGELANSKLRFSGTLGEDQRIARQIERLEKQGEWNREHGFLDLSKDRFDSADELRKSLSSNVLEKDRMPFKTLEENSTKTNDHLKELLRKASAEGLNIVPKIAS